MQWKLQAIWKGIAPLKQAPQNKDGASPKGKTPSMHLIEPYCVFNLSLKTFLNFSTFGCTTKVQYAAFGLFS